MTTETWNAVIDENTCDECRALHGKPISEIGMIPPLHGMHDPQERKPCRCTIRTEARAETTRTPPGPRLEDRPTHDELKAQYSRMTEYNARHFGAGQTERSERSSKGGK